MYGARNSGADATSGRVLIVEDDYLLARDIEGALSSSGVSIVGPHPSLDRAINAINMSGVDAAVVDVHLQDGPAYPIADLLTKFRIPFVFATANPRLVPERFSWVKVHEKPFRLDVLAKSVKALLNSIATISYSVRRREQAWEWRVLRGEAVIARGECDSCVGARIEALQSAMQLNKR